MQKPVRWYVLSLPRTAAKAREDMEDALRECRTAGLPPFEYFSPTFVKVVEGERRTMPLLFNYVFLRATLPYVRQFRSTHPRYNLISAREARPDEPFLYVPDEEMDVFIRIAKAYGRKVPCYAPDEVQLQKGDRVRVIGGTFTGIEGTLISQQGKDGGVVVIEVSGLFSVPLLHLRPQYIELLSFAKEGRHLYDRLDSFRPKALRAILHHLSPQGTDEKDRASLSYFLTRMSRLDLSSPKMRPAYQACLAMAYTATEETEQAREAIRLCRKELAEVTNAATQLFIHTALYACTQEAAHLAEARRLAQSLRRKPLSKRDAVTIAALNELEQLHSPTP